MKTLIGLALVIATGFGTASQAAETAHGPNSDSATDPSAAVPAKTQTATTHPRSIDTVYYECFAPDGTLGVKIYQSDPAALAMAGGAPEPASMSIDHDRKVFHFVDGKTGEPIPNKGFVILGEDNSAAYTVKKGGGVRVLANDWQCQEKDWPESSSDE